MNHNFTKAAVCLMFAAGMLFSCKKDIQSISNGETKTNARSVLGTNSQNFDSYTTGSYYYEGSYNANFGNNSSNSWFYDRTYISNGSLKVILKAYQVGVANGGI